MVVFRHPDPHLPEPLPVPGALRSGGAAGCGGASAGGVASPGLGGVIGGRGHVPAVPGSSQLLERWTWIARAPIPKGAGARGHLSRGGLYPGIDGTRWLPSRWYLRPRRRVAGIYWARWLSWL